MSHPTAKGVLDFMDGLVEQLRQTVPMAFRHGDEDAVHDARVATRRLKAALDLTQPLISPSRHTQLKRVGRKLRRRLGPLRDLDVMLGHLAELPAGPGGGRAGGRVARAIEWSCGLLAEQRRDARRASSRVSVPETLAALGVWWGIREEIGVTPPDVVDDLLQSSLRGQLDEFVGQATRLAACAGSPAADAPDAPAAPEDPHALRIAGKLLRYTLELAGATGRQLPGAVMATFRRLQDDLGLWHDFVVLHQSLLHLALDRELACHDRDLYEQVLELSRIAWRRAQHHLRIFVTRWSRQGSKVADGIPQMLLNQRMPSPASSAPSGAPPTSTAAHSPETGTD